MIGLVPDLSLPHHLDHYDIRKQVENPPEVLVLVFCGLIHLAIYYDQDHQCVRFHKFSIALKYGGVPMSVRTGFGTS